MFTLHYTLNSAGHYICQGNLDVADILSLEFWEEPMKNRRETSNGVGDAQFLPFSSSPTWGRDAGTFRLAFGLESSHVHGQSLQDFAVRLALTAPAKIAIPERRTRRAAEDAGAISPASEIEFRAALEQKPSTRTESLGISVPSQPRQDPFWDHPLSSSRVYELLYAPSADYVHHYAMTTPLPTLRSSGLPAHWIDRSAQTLISQGWTSRSSLPVV
ncbi:hypothetical protein K449DRAFT_435790 [Hypoxylon sp. EC38]|nr:hypothetical protein K449DRAFT_435790 [Hypoxylon sp. EC38]